MSIEFDIEIIRSDRKTISIEIDATANVKLRVPKRTTKQEIENVINAKQDWIRDHIKKQKEKTQNQASVKKFSFDEVNVLADKALEILPERIKHYASLMNVKYNKITVRDQKTRWGSCSEKGNLNFNCLLVLLPKDICDYVIVHELAHLIEMNHSKKFWDEVAKMIPDYSEKVKWLKQNGNRYISMLPK